MVRTASTLLALIVLAKSAPAFAQYTNAQFGFEAGYLFYGTTNDRSVAAVENHGPMVGVRTAWKLNDHVWITNRASFAWRDQVQIEDRTIYILHLVPAAVRYYFLTNRVRPFVGLTSSFQIFLNGRAGTFFWGPGGSAGVELRLRRNVFLGVQLDALHVWGDASYPVLASTLQLDFFL